MIRRDKLIVLGLIALLVVTSAAAVATDQGERGLAPEFGGVYVEGVPGAPQLLNPLLATTNLDQDVVRLAFSGLTRLDRDGTIRPDLAERVEVDETGRVWTFRLRPEAFWHDGREVTADDVVFTVGLVQERGYAGPYAEAFRDVVVERVERRVVRFRLPGVFGPFAESTTLPLLPAHALQGVTLAELARQPFNLRPIGTGPFRVVEVDRRQVVLTRHDQFHRTRPERTRPYLDRIILRSYRDSADAVAALARGEIDGTSGLTSPDADRVRGLPTIQLRTLPTSDFAALFLNLRPAATPLHDRSVRQAIAAAIDRERVLRVAGEGRGRIADQLAPPGSWAHTSGLRVTTHAPEQARQLLDQAGWTLGPDGVRTKDGTTLRTAITTSQEPARIAAAQLIARDLTEIGISAQVDSVPFAELVDRVVRQRSFEMLLVGISTGADPDPYPLFHSSQVADPGSNFSGFSTLSLDRILESARRTHEPDRRRELYAAASDQIAREVPAVLLYFEDHLYAQHRSVSGQLTAPINDRSGRLWNVEDWYVRTRPRR